MLDSPKLSIVELCMKMIGNLASTNFGVKQKDHDRR
jgi:hypothetical protein